MALMSLAKPVCLNNKNKAAAPHAAGGGRSIYALFVHLYFGVAKNLAGTTLICFLYNRTWY